MNIVLLYLRILKKSDPKYPEQTSYAGSAIRFLASYREHKPTVKHKLVIVDCGDSHKDNMFDEIADDYARYDGGGYDCGTYQAVGGPMKCDMVVGMNTHVHFTDARWLERFVRAFKLFGPGVYGTSGSFERYPHLRTPCIAFAPEIMRRYSLVADCRNSAALFESGPGNLSLAMHQLGVPSKMVTWDGIYGLEDWRMPPNIFRRGDQSNCIVRDRHMDIFEYASPADKLTLSRKADYRN
jgi:hypothetical protein